MSRQSTFSQSRRAFLKRTGWSAAGLTVLTSCSGVLPVLPHQKPPEEEGGLSWVQMLPGGRVRFYCPRMEMGQGISTGLIQLVAEELNIAPDAIDCVTPSTGQVPPFKLTAGSESMELFYRPVSMAAASLREHLRGQAAIQLNADPSEIKEIPGGFQTKGGKSVSYADLVPTGSQIISLNDNTVTPEQLKVYEAQNGALSSIEQPAADPALLALVTGREVFSRDVSLPGMVHGGALFPPAPDATVLEVDGSKARAMPGVLAVVEDKSRGFAGVVADKPDQVRQALAAITVTWGHDPGDGGEHPAARLKQFWQSAEREFEHELLSNGQDTGQAAPLKARYQTPFQAHAAIEPRSGSAWVQKDKVEVWCGTQAPFFVQGRIAQLLGRSQDDVTVYPKRMGGAFGGRVPCQPAETAALLSEASGYPVKVQWSREDEFRHNYYQPPFFHEIEASADETGTIDQWHHDFASAPILFGLKEIPKIAHVVLDRLADKGTARGGLPPYGAKNQRIRYSDIRLPISTGAWRGLGTLPNNFAIESMVDELADKAQMDPLEFRLKNLAPDHGRLESVLKKAAEMARWGRRMPTSHGLGIAGGIYRGKTHVAAVAEVRLDADERHIAIEKVWVAQDCGLVINPDQVKQQITGNAIWGVGAALSEEMIFDEDRLETDNFDSYAILRQSEAPEVEIALINPQNENPTGSGEPAIGPIAPAITNAIFAASGKRLRKLPIDTDAVFDQT